jgi:hypothetical protein
MTITEEQFKRLKALARAKDKATIKRLLKEGGQGLQTALRECALNIIRGNVKLSPQQLQRLKKHKNSLRELAKKRTSVKRRIQIEQRGGFFWDLVTPLKTILPKVIGGYVKSTKKFAEKIHRPKKKNVATSLPGA